LFITSEMSAAICEPLDWNISSIICDSNYVPVLPSCFQNFFLNLTPLVFILVGAIQFGCGARNIKIKVGIPQRLTWLRIIAIVGILVALLLQLLQTKELPLSDQISLGTICSFLLFLFLLILFQDFSNTGSIPALFYFWLLFTASRLPPVLVLINGTETHLALPVLTLTLASLGFILECFPLKFKEKIFASPEDQCSHASDLLYGWLDPVFWRGVRTPLTKHQVPPLREAFAITNILDGYNRQKKSDKKFAGKHYVSLLDVTGKDEEVIYIEDNNTKNIEKSIVVSLTKSFGSQFLIAAVMKLIQDLLKFVIPQLLKGLIGYIDNYNAGVVCGSSPWLGYFFAVSIFLVGITQAILLQAYWKITYSVALRARTALFSEIYKKTLNISSRAKKDYTVGEIVTLMSSDAQTFKQVIPSLNKVWSMPLQIILAIYFLYQELGLSVFGGVFILILLIPFNTYMGKKSQSVNKKQMKAKGTRLRRMYELLNSIKVIKLYAWEKIFENRVTLSRNSEIRFLRRNGILKAVINFVFGSAPIFVTLVSFALYVSVDKENVLTPEKAFVCLTLFSMLRLPMKLLPNILTEIFRLNVSIKRINAFLNFEEMRKYVGYSINPGKDIQIADGAFAWNEGSPFLHDINLSVKAGSLHIIAGPTASGKTSLLSSILGQMIHIKGSINTARKSIAYVSQDSWIQNKTIKENILFGKPYDPAWYSRVVECCALEADLVLLAGGDSTMLGDNGVNLSGGQKQRISLARAVYSNADIFLLDDCLSAVDVHVCRHISEQVLGNKGLLRGKTRLMVSHNPAVIGLADYISYMEHGTIIKTEETTQHTHQVIQHVQDKEVEHSRIVDETKAKKQEEKVEEKKSKDVEDRLKDKSVGTGSAFVSSCKMYLKNFGFVNVVLVLLMFVLNQSLVTGSSVWLTYWADTKSMVETNKTHEHDNNFYIGVYGGIGLATATCAFFRNLCIFICAAGASRYIHTNLFQRIIRAKLSFIESTSSGSIVSRFSSDMDAVDQMIPGQMSALLFNTFEVLAVIITISLSSPEFLIAVALILVLLYIIKIFYIKTSRQIKRLESSSNAPIYAHFNETIRGLSVIKAFDEIPRFINTLEELTAVNLNYSYYSIMCSRWLSLRSEMVAQILVLSASFVAVIHRDTLSPGWAGLIVSLALGITETFTCLLVALTNLEDQATVVERIKELTEHTPQEPEWTSDNPPESSWPEKGVVSFKHFSTGYSREETVLTDISFETCEGEKVAIVGRTGAGKSSIGLSCLRVLEAHEGNILIDNVDISRLGLHELRSAVTIIPQDPILFSGSLRENIDPLGVKDDTDIIKLLRTANLESYQDLNMEVEEGGDNFSHGEKQLICLVRALCRGSRVVILDEATASMDEETDSNIQKLIREEFGRCTVLTIAHRLNTILDYDRVVVLDRGEVREVGQPAALAQDTQSCFYGMLHTDS